MYIVYVCVYFQQHNIAAETNIQLKLLGDGTQMSNPFLSVPDSESLRRDVGTYWAPLTGSQIDKYLSTISGE